MFGEGGKEADKGWPGAPAAPEDDQEGAFRRHAMEKELTSLPNCKRKGATLELQYNEDDHFQAFLNNPNF